MCVSVEDQEKDSRAEIHGETNTREDCEWREAVVGRGNFLFLGTFPSKLSRFLSHPFKKFDLSLIFLLS